jgi:transposase
MGLMDGIRRHQVTRMPMGRPIRSGRTATRLSGPEKHRTKSGSPYSAELRSRVIAAVEAGASYRQAAARYGVSASTIVKWVRQFHRTGSVTAKPMGGDRRSRLKDQRDWLLRRIAADPTLTPADLHQELCARGVQVGYLTVRRFIKRETSGMQRPASPSRTTGKGRGAP